MKTKEIVKELVENYCKGKLNEKYKIISCGAEEMVRFIRKIVIKERRKIRDKIKKL